MRVIMLTADYLPNIGGVAAHVYHLSRALGRLGVEVAVVNPVAGEAPAGTCVGDGPPVYHACYRRQPGPLLENLALAAAARAGLRQAWRELGPVDVIHQHDYPGSTLAARRWRRHAAWVWTNHSSGFLRHVRSRWRRALLRRVFAEVAGVIAVSSEILEHSQALWGRHRAVELIPNGVDTAAFHPGLAVSRARYGLAPGDFVVLCPRRMVEKNGVIYLAQAVSQILTQAPGVSWRFVFLGSDPAVNTRADYISQVKAVLAPAEAKGHVRYLGNLPLPQMPEVNALADLVVIPSLVEAISLSALEAMACRRPVIASAVGGLPEIISDGVTGLLVPPADAAALAKAVLQLQAQPQYAGELARRGYELASTRYGWDTVARRTLSFYHRVLQGNPADAIAGATRAG